MKKLTPVFILIFITNLCLGQNAAPTTDTLCQPAKIYATPDDLYKASWFKNYPNPDQPPSFPGGKDSLLAFFTRLVQLNGEETQIVARYHVIVVISCQGKPCRIELKSKAFPGAQKILDACQKMPDWKPAQAKVAPVDCYIRLGFTNRGGTLEID